MPSSPCGGQNEKTIVDFLREGTEMEMIQVMNGLDMWARVIGEAREARGVISLCLEIVQKERQLNIFKRMKKRNLNGQMRKSSQSRVPWVVGRNQKKRFIGEI